MKVRSRWGIAIEAALVVMLVCVSASLWLWLQVRSLEVNAFEHAAIRQVAAAASSPEIAQAWLAGPDALQQELIELSLVSSAQVTALTAGGEFLAQSHSAAADDTNQVVGGGVNLPGVRVG